MKALFIDIGSTFVKYAVYEDEKYLLSDKIPFPAPVNENAFTVERERIDRIIFDIMDIAKTNLCDSVFISVQMHGYIIRDAKGNFSDYYSWRCGGGDTEALKAIDFSKRGTCLKENLPLAKLYPLRDRLCGSEYFTLGSYVVYLLTGRNITHKTDACASGFYDADSLACDSETIKGIIFPTAFDEVAVCGSYGGMRIYSPVGDHAVSFFGSMVDDDAYLLNIGTTSQIAFLGKGEKPSEMWESRPYFDKATKLFTLGNLLYGLCGDAERYCTEIVRIIDTLQRRKKVVLGGGGAVNMIDILKPMLKERGIECETIGCNIGIRGLEMLSQTCKVKAGIMLSEVPFTNMPLIMKNSGLDFMIVDNEHGAFDYTSLAKMFTVSRMADFITIVRLPDNSRAWITKCVDAGADGFLLPMTNTVEDIAKVVEYAKYAPIGKRGISTMRAHTLYAPPALDEYMPAANERIKVYAQIETAKGVENIEEILAATGVDGVFIGPNDLSCDLGCIGDNTPIFEAIEKVADAAKNAGKPFGIITTAKALLDKAIECGASMISYGSELNMLANECDKIRKMF